MRHPVSIWPAERRAAAEPARIAAGEPATPPGEGRTFREDINGLRALSVVLVVAFHLHVRGAGGGFLGVDVFFVISGYLMTQILWPRLLDGRLGYWRFIGARAARIWPALAAMVLALLALGALLLPPFDLRMLAEQARWALGFASNVYFERHAGYDTRVGDSGWLQHTWSLAVEWQFYMLYPFVLWPVARLSRALGWGDAPRARALALCALPAALMAVSLAWHVVQSQARPDAAFFLLPARAWEMLAGGLAYFARPAGATPGPRVAMIASRAGFVLLVASVLWFGARHVDPVGTGWQTALPVGAVALMLWGEDRRNPLLGHAASQHVGRWSYSIYLWHWPLIVALRLADVSSQTPWASAAIVVAGSVLLGALSYRCVESRVASRPAAPGGAPARRGVRLAVTSMLLAGGLSTVVAATGGLAFRVPQQDADFRAYAASLKTLYFPDACSNFRKPVDEMKPCTIERAGPPGARVLVIGDSHAEHLYAWFLRHSTVAVDFYTAAECPPVPRLERMQAGFHCREYADEAWARAASATYDTVVVSALWATAGLEGAPYCHAGDAATCVEVRGDEKRRLILDGLRGAIEGLLRQGKRVIVFDGTPVARVRVPERLARELFWTGERRLRIERQALDASSGWIDPLFRSFVGRPGYRLVSLREQLCDAASCRVYDAASGRPIYIDESHLDPAWIAAQAQLLPDITRGR